MQIIILYAEYISRNLILKELLLKQAIQRKVNRFIMSISSRTIVTSLPKKLEEQLLQEKQKRIFSHEVTQDLHQPGGNTCT